jgi:transcriptional regulator with XRE-family HTH domain
MACVAPAHVCLSEGARRLRVIRGVGVQRTHLKDIAGQLGVSRQFVSMLLEGQCLPKLALAVRIEAIYKIVPREWLTPANADTQVTLASCDRHDGAEGVDSFAGDTHE